MTQTQWETIPETPRDYWGRPLVIPLGGGKPIPYTRATTYVSCLEDTYNLGKWQIRMAARGLSIREDLFLRVNSLGPEPDDDEAASRKWKREMDKLGDQAIEAAKASAAANYGTALHTLTERLDRGQKVEDVPREYRKHLKAYQEATKDFTAVQIERFMVNDHLQVGGTPDRILTTHNQLAHIIGDVKTGSVDYGMGKIAMQLAMYAHSTCYNPPSNFNKDKIYTPEEAANCRQNPGPINQNRGLIIALDAKTGDCKLVWVDLQAGWEAIQLCTQVKAWRAKKNLATPYEESPHPEPIDRFNELAIYRAIATARNYEELSNIWNQHQSVWTPQMTERATQRKQQLGAKT